MNQSQWFIHEVICLREHQVDDQSINYLCVRYQITFRELSWEQMYDRNGTRRVRDLIIRSCILIPR